MPRERAHWFVLSEAARMLPSGSLVRRVLQDEPSWAALGAVLPDAPYYRARGTDEFAQEVGERIHGCNAEDTFALMRVWGSRISADIPGPEQQAAWALWLGFLSHLVLDQEAHPMIFYLTGDYYHSDPHARSAARARHRLLEVYLEATIPPHESGVNKAKSPGLISQITRDLENRSRAPLAIFTSLNFEEWKGSPLAPGEHTSAAHHVLWESSISDLAGIQERLLSNTQGLLLRILSSFSGTRLKGIDALCSFGRSQPEPELLRPLSFRNPCSGLAFSQSPLEVFSNASKRLATLFQGVEPAVKGGIFESQFLPPDQGRSLCFNLMGVKVSDATHYSSEGLPLPGLRIQ